MGGICTDAYNDQDRPAGGACDELPLGLGMSLMQQPDALQRFGTLSLSEKSRVIAFVQCSVTGEEARQRIDAAVAALSRGELDFLK